MFDISVMLLLMLILILIFSKNNTNDNKKDEIEIYRDIPCNKDLFYAYWLAVNYKIVDKKENFFGAVLLKWIYDGNVKLEYNNKYSQILFKKRPTELLEGKLYDYMFSASLDGKLEINEFKKWCEKNSLKILGWFSDVIYFESMELMKNSKLILKKNIKMYFFDCKHFEKEPILEEDAKKLQGLKKFLEEFTLINEKTPIEVNLWNEYLIYAQMFGIADKVADKFRTLYPELIEHISNNNHCINNIKFINSLTISGIKTANLFKNYSTNSYRNKNYKSGYRRSSFDIISRANSYSSGGRGFSSSSGGKRSFGSGRGGGGFR